MANVRTFTLPHYHAYPVHVAVFKDVTNASYLRSQLLAANPEFDYAFLDAEMVRSFACECHFTREAGCICFMNR
jgi:EKC/KEOPS complex subunit CGI121/TPRKB